MEINDAMLASALIKVKSRDLSLIPEDSEINYSFSRDFERKMEILISSFDKTVSGSSAFRKTLTKAAVIILTLSIGAFSLIMISPQARAAVKNAVTEFYESYIKFYFVSDDTSLNDFTDYEKIYADYTVNGFELKEKYEEFEAVGYRYENEEEKLAYDIYVSLNEGLSVHTDKNNFEEITVSGRASYLISGKQDNKPYSTLIITGNKITVTIYGQIDKNEIIRIGESLKEDN